MVLQAGASSSFGGRRIGVSRCAALVVIGIFICTIGALPADALPAYTGVEARPLQYGPTPAEIDAELDAAHQLGAKVVREEVPWSVLEPRVSDRPDPGYLWLLDYLMGAAQDRGMRVIVVLYSTPCWASSASEVVRRFCGPGQGQEVWWTGTAARYPPRRPAEYARVAARVAYRYRGPLLGIEIWNEPDLDRSQFLIGPDRAATYAALLRAAYPAIKSVNRDVQVLGGSLADASSSFLRRLYAKGIKGFYDGLAVHSFGLTLASLRAFRQTQKKAGDRKPLWLTEFGSSTCPEACPAGQNWAESGLEQGLNQSVVLATIPRRSFVRAAILYRLSDGAGQRTRFGLLEPDGTPKASFGIVRATLAGKPPPLRITLNVRRRRGRLVAFGRAPAGDVVVLSAEQLGGGAGSSSVTRIATPRRDWSYSIALPQAMERGHWRMRIESPWTRRKAGRVLRN